MKALKFLLGSVTVLVILLNDLYSQRVRVNLGAPEMVFDWSAMSDPNLNGYDLPDLAAKAFRRRDDGAVVLLYGGPPYNYMMVGRNFNLLTTPRDKTFVTGDDLYPHTFNNQAWLTSVYIQGETVHGFIHNEFHDIFPDKCDPHVTTPENPCWWNAITYCRSTNSGRDFRMAKAPNNVVAALPTPWRPGPPNERVPSPHGYMAPSNIVRARDGYFYCILFLFDTPTPTSASSGMAIMRTKNLADAASWRGWDGSGFNLTMASPYDVNGNPQPTGLPPLAYISHSKIGTMGGSLTYNTYFDQYIMVGVGTYLINGQLVCGSYFSLSHDLINWSDPIIIKRHKLPWCVNNQPNELPDGSLLYPSLINHNDETPNFEITGQENYLYMVRWNHGLDRDLIRYPIRFEIVSGSIIASVDEPEQEKIYLISNLINQEIIFDGSITNGNYSVTNQMGQDLEKGRINGKRILLSNELLPGLYFINTFNSKGVKVNSEMFIKK